MLLGNVSWLAEALVSSQSKYMSSCPMVFNCRLHYVNHNEKNLSEDLGYPQTSAHIKTYVRRVN